jgi:hypothetical protein
VNKDKLLKLLKSLLPTQFEEIVFRLGIPPAELAGTQASQASRAMELIRCADSNGERRKLEKLVFRVIDGTSPTLRPEVAAALDKYRKSKRSGSDAWEQGFRRFLGAARADRQGRSSGERIRTGSGGHRRSGSRGCDASRSCRCAHDGGPRHRIRAGRAMSLLVLPRWRPGPVAQRAGSA